MLTSISISSEEYQSRCDLLLEYLQTENLSGVVLFDSHYILYYSGFAFIPTERPISFVMNARGEKALFVPRLELEHAKSNATIHRVDHYLEYPHEPHPMEVLKSLLDDLGIRKNIGMDHDGYPWKFGYRGYLASAPHLP